MKKSFICTMAMLSFANSSLSADNLSEPRHSPSNYVSEESCRKIERKFSVKYTDEYFNNLLGITKNEIPSLQQIVTDIRTPSGRDLPFTSQLDVMKLARCQGRFDDVIYSLISEKIYQLEDLNSDRARNLPEPSMSLESYLSKKKTIEKISKKRGSKEIAFPLTKFPVDALSNKNITVNERLYALYSPGQIKKMAQIMDLTLNIMDALKVETKIVFREDSQKQNYVVEHTPSDVYRLALRIFMMEKKKLIQDNSSNGLPFSNLDILAAAYEMGVVSGGEIGILTSDESFYRKDKSLIQKMGAYVAKIGITSAQINPATAPYALVGLILYNSYQEINHNKERVELENFYFN